MKRVLITGAAGFIGSHLSERFLNEGFAVVAVDNFLTGDRGNIAHLLSNPNFEFIEQDVSIEFNIKGKLDIILHFACPASPVDYMKHPIETLRVDSIGTMNTLDLALAKGSRYVFASTSEVYGDPEVHPQKETYWGNVNSIGPRSVYDEAKRFSEALIMAYHRKHGLDARILRIFNTYGPRMRLGDGRVVPNFITQALRGEDLTVYGDGSQTRSFCYIDDLVDGILAACSKKGISGEVFNMGNPDEYKIMDFAEIVIRQTGAESKIIRMPLPEDDPKQRCPDISKASAAFGWRPKVKLSDGLSATIEHFKDRVGG